jgi:purine-cytosine permease-like protein
MSVKELPYPEIPPQYPQPIFANHMYPSYGMQQAESPSLKMGRKIRATFYAALLFVVLSFGGTYRVTNNVLSALMNRNFEIVNETGCPTMKGILLHTVVFFVIAFFFINNV